MDKKDKRFRGVFFCTLDDGQVTDISEEMLEHDNIIRKQLEKAGIIRRFLVCDKEPKD